MGKYGRNDSNGAGGRPFGRKASSASFSPAKSNSRVIGGNGNKKVLAKFDARLKLLQKEDAVKVAKAFGQTTSTRFIRDARDLLNRKQKKAKKSQMRKDIAYDRNDAMDDDLDEDDEAEESQPNRNGRASKSTEPVVIVTGLGNIRKNGDKIEVIQNKKKSEFMKQHLVLSNGTNTIVTLNNDLAAKSRRNKPNNNRNGQDDDDVDEATIEEEIRGSRSLRNLAPLKIRVENDISRRDSDRDSSPKYSRMYSEVDYRNHHHQQQQQRSNYQPEPSYDPPYRPSSSRLPPASSIAYPPPNDHLNGRLHYNEPRGHDYAPNYYHDDRRPIRPNPVEYHSSSSRFNHHHLPPPTHNSHSHSYPVDHDQEGMDYEETGNSYHSHESARAPVIKSSLSSRSRSHASTVTEDGFRVVVSNLHQNVTKEDIMELFSDIGPIKDAKFREKGVAEVIYVNLDDAYSAIKKYDQKELDGQAMKIQLTSNNAPPKTSQSASQSSSNRHSSPEKPIIKVASSTSSSSGSQSSTNMANNTLSNRFKIYPANAKVEKISLPDPNKIKTGNSSNKVNQVDASIIHQVLFSKKQTSSNPVTFTVKL